MLQCNDAVTLQVFTFFQIWLGGTPPPRPHQVGFSVPSVYADFLAFWILGFLDRMKVLRESLWGL